MPQGVKKTLQQAAAKGLSKMEAMRRSLAELGADAKPLELKDYLKKTFDIDMDTSVISTYKGSLKKKPAKAAAPVTSNGSTPVVSSSGKTAGSLSLGDIQAVKTLVNKIGSDNVRALVDVLGK